MDVKKIVITGGPGTGKSAIIAELLQRGHNCMLEISRQVTLEARKNGTEQLFLTNPLLFSELLLKGRKKQFTEANNSDSELVFMDRGIPDVLAYMDYIGDIYPMEFIETCKTHVYDHVFILSPWQEIYVSDSERYENFEQAVKIHHHLLNTYERYDYHLIDVPFENVKKRADHILDIIGSI
ncbi:MAG: ATP-binding protein [Flavobacteriaceae bacterium]|nr:ATP-binding protein [Flavobacteriaceae bacterium]